LLDTPTRIARRHFCHGPLPGLIALRQGAGARVVFAAAGLVAFGGPLPAQDSAVPGEVPFPILARVLAFDRQLKQRAGDEIVVGLVFQAHATEPRTTRDAVLAEAPTDVSIGGAPVRVLPIPTNDIQDIDAAISANAVDVLYVTPLRSVDLDDLTVLSRRRHVLTCTGVPDYVSRGLAVGIEAGRDGPIILINLAAAKAEGAEFSSELLRLARIVEGS